MSNFQYKWENGEANFGKPVTGEVPGGTHISCECILEFEGQYIALRRPEAIPGHEVPKKAHGSDKGLLYFVHGLPRWGERMEQYLERVVREQAGVGVKDYRVVHMDMEVYEESEQWAWTPYIIVELDRLPVSGTYSNEVNEVVAFSRDSIPDEFGWWSNTELLDFLTKHDKAYSHE